MFRKLSPFSRYSHFKIRDLNNVGKGRDVQRSTTFAVGLFDGTNSYRMAIVMLVFSSVYLPKQSLSKFDIENWIQGHRVQLPQWSNSTGNINLYKSDSWAFVAMIFIYFQKLCELENIDQGHDVLYSQWRHSMASFNPYNSRTWGFFAHRFSDIVYSYISTNCVTLKHRSRSRCTTFAMAPFDG